MDLGLGIAIGMLGMKAFTQADGLAADLPCADEGERLVLCGG